MCGTLAPWNLSADSGLKAGAEGGEVEHVEGHSADCADDFDVRGSWRLPLSLLHWQAYVRSAIHDSGRSMYRGLRTASLLLDRGRLCAHPSSWT
jgi:hypothetical protein